MKENDLKLYELYLNKIKETDEISFKLLGLVPLLSGAGIFTLLTQNAVEIDHVQIQIPKLIFWVTGLFGASITYCIYRWELRNIQTCKTYRNEARKIEETEPGSIGVFRNFPESPDLLIKVAKKVQFKMQIGKADAEKGIYYLTIIFWLLLPVLKMYMH
jgi:hypothetical protein